MDGRFDARRGDHRGVGAPSKAEAPPAAHKVSLRLNIAGLGRGGCDVDVKPAHAGCTVPPSRPARRPRREGQIDLDDVRSTGADRDCSFAITIREPGHADKTVRRGFQLAAPVAGRPAVVQSFDCYLSSPSLLARNSDHAHATLRRRDRPRHGAIEPGRRLTKAIDFPSGDQAGSRSPSDASSRGTTVPLARSSTTTELPGRPR